tara:strand:+ start:567 stop:1907 length:1341 start_codon:yes stop_codon:yes gene_type:complete
MGVIEGTYITLTNYTKKKIEDLERGEKLLSCKIEDLKPMSHSNIAMSWTKKDPTILKEESSVKFTSTNSVAIYRIINNKLKISLDHVIFTKDGETDECSWNNVKSLRRGDLIFNESYEFEEITSLKKIKEGVSMVVLSLSGYPYYFANGYLIHNLNFVCENCNYCFWHQRTILPYGRHVWNSPDYCNGGHWADMAGYVSGSVYHGPGNINYGQTWKTQAYAYGDWTIVTGTVGFGGDQLIYDDFTPTIKAGVLYPWNAWASKLQYDVNNNFVYHYLYKVKNGWWLTSTEPNTTALAENIVDTYIRTRQTDTTGGTPGSTDMGGLKPNGSGGWTDVAYGQAGINFAPVCAGTFKIYTFHPHVAPTIKWTTAPQPSATDWNEWTASGGGPSFAETTDVRFKMYMRLNPSNTVAGFPAKNYKFRITVDHNNTNNQYNPKSGYIDLNQYV